MAWYDEIVDTTKGNVQGLVNALRNPVDTTKQFLKGGEKNRKIAAALLQGDTAPLKQAFANMTPQDMENAMMNVGMTYAPMGMFIGKGSKVWNPNNEQLFLQLEKQGMSPEQIWSKTGTLRAPDKMLRQEIPDTEASINDAVYEGIKKNKNYSGPLSNSMRHKELYKAYPEVKDIYTTMYASPLPEGSFESASKTIAVGGPSTGHQKSTALHEVQHGIQNIEGWARGGSLDDMGGYANQYNQAKSEFDEALKIRLNPDAGEIEKDNARQIMEFYGPKLSKLKEISDPKEAYRRLAGEAEARLTQRRLKLSSEERLKNYPYIEGQYGLDVPYESLIVKK